MKKIVTFVSFILISYIGFCQTDRSTGANCTVPSGWTSCSSSCWFSECCIIWNPNVSEGGCGCWFGVALCKTGLIGQRLEISNTSSADAIVKFSFDRFSEFLTFLNSKGILTGSILPGFNTFKSNYTLTSGRVSVQTNHYIEFQNLYVNYVNAMTYEQKNLLINFITDKEKPKQ